MTLAATGPAAKPALPSWLKPIRPQHVLTALFLNFVVLGFLVVGEQGTNLGGRFLVNVAHLGPVVVARTGSVFHDFLHLIALILQDSFDLRFLSEDAPKESALATLDYTGWL